MSVGETEEKRAMFEMDRDGQLHMNAASGHSDLHVFLCVYMLCPGLCKPAQLVYIEEAL